VAPVELRVDEQQDERAGDADGRVDRLACEEVVRVPGDVVRGDPVDRPEAKGEQSRDGAEQPPVEPADRRGGLERLGALRAAG